MPLPDEHLIYPHRAYGMDQDRYAWRPSTVRAPIALPSGAAVTAMIVVPIEHHPLNPSGKPFKHPGAMVTPYPDLRHYTTRDYGNRVGVYRILDALKAAGVKATFPINADQLERLKPLVETILADGHEIATYGLSTTHIHWGGLDRETETAWVAEVRARFDAAGLSPRAWLSPARQQSFATLDLIRAAGFDICLDWEQDEVPVAMTTDAGEVIGLPLSNELDDRSLMIDRRQTEDEWASQVLEAASYLTDGAGRFGGRVLGFTLTPYVTGQPFRISALRRLLAGLGELGVKAMTASEIAS
ncbi:polysaccharide deacetylase [Caulobacter sp. D4A]|uniref:polysaccharide deacetylase family protein n=1 Tax=unclassified Caulobacter TaxID=2648921 RepID=UPI000D726D30|nr:MULTISPECIES: polysaccharide deacetylase family protein [unclassified Caulobacter]PXA72850.1 polysaccharide deacetylase [Caulobacter sp. D4A]PXA91161.1 polysaccharide deacetylase [Caulobacter sp. D5]